jgi:REP element-mobilizing transposase RayT
LSEIGEIVENETIQLKGIYDIVDVDCFVVMPNHVHMIIVILPNGRTQSDGRTQFAPTVSRIIKQWKGVITKKVGYPLWQKSFHDHIIRDENEYNRIAEYIENNPANWEEDCFHPSKVEKNQ